MDGKNSINMAKKLREFINSLDLMTSLIELKINVNWLT